MTKQRNLKDCLLLVHCGGNESKIEMKRRNIMVLLYDCTVFSFSVCLDVIGAGHFRDSRSSRQVGGQRGDEWDWLHHNIRYNKPLIWWSICSRTSSSIIHPAVRHHRGSGAAQEPDGVNSFPHVHDSAPVHQSTCLSPSAALQTWLSALWWNVDEDVDVWDDTFYLTFETRDKAERERERSALVSELDQIPLPANMCSLLFGLFAACICFVSEHMWPNS